MDIDDALKRRSIKVLEDEQKELEATQTDDQPKAAKKSCGCC